MKDAYYFSHDCNARNDAKIVRLRRKLGMEGYGIYFAIVEMLREDSSHKLLTSSYEDIAYQIVVDSDKVKSVINDFDLFVIDDNYFYSPRLTRSMKEYNELKNKRKQAGKKGVEAKAQANIKQTSSKPQANLDQNETKPQALKEKKGKEIKGKEKKEKEIIIPTLEDVISYFDEKGYSEESARKAFAHYEAGDWHDANGNRVKNWKQKMNSVWFREEHKKKKSPIDDIDKYRNMRGFDEIMHKSSYYFHNIEKDNEGNERIKYYPNGHRL